MVVLTWNVNQQVLPKSAQAPADDRVWSAADNFEGVQAEVLRLQPDVVSLHECAGAAAAPRLAEKYDLLDSRPGHAEEAGYVHLYVRKALAATALRVPGLPGVACAAKLRHTEVVFVALHLAAGEAAKGRREKHLRRAMQLATARSATVVLFGDLNLPDAELAPLAAPAVGGRGPVRSGAGRLDRLQEAAYSGSSWHPQVNRYSDEEGYATRARARFECSLPDTLGSRRVPYDRTAI